MNEDQLRDTKTKPKGASNSNLSNPIASITTTNNALGIDPSSLNLINFLTSMMRMTLEVCDPKYENILPEEWPRICQEKCNRNISLIEGIRNPEKVFPRTKWEFSYSRPADNNDLSFIWYRSFVTVADWANSIPEFRMLPEEDQAQLLRVNFTTLSFMVFLKCSIPPDPSVIPLGNGSYIGNNQPGYYINFLILLLIFSRISELCTSIIDAYVQHVINPFKEVGADLSECALLYAINLFQYFEGLSSEGRNIAKTYVDRLHDAFFDYQIMRMPQASPKERSRRQTQILFTIAKMPVSFFSLE